MSNKKLTIELVLSRSNNKNPETIKTLNLWGLKLTDISILKDFPSLELISLSSNQIKDISAFKNSKNLRELYLKDNQIKDLSQIEYLKGCSKLEKLIVKNNPIVNIPNYFDKIIDILPQLKNLDDKDIEKKNYNINSPLASNNSHNNSFNNNSGINSESSSKNDSAAPDPKALFPPEMINDNNGGNIINDHNNDHNNNEHNEHNQNIIERNEHINFNNVNKINNSKQINNNIIRNKDKIINGNNGKIRNKINISSNINKKTKNVNPKNESLKSNFEKNENYIKMSQTSAAGFYQNPFSEKNKNNNNLNGYRKKIVGNFKHEQQKTMIDVINAKKFDNEENELNENKINHKGNSANKRLYKKNKSQTGVLNNNMKKTKMNSVKTQREIKAKKIMEIDSGKKNEIKNGGISESVNESVIQSIKLLMDTLSVDSLKIIQNDIQKLISNKK